MEDYKNEAISAFAFKTGKEIERMVNEASGGLRETNMQLEARIMGYFAVLRKRAQSDSGVDNHALHDYATYFNITEQREGKIEDPNDWLPF